MDSLPMQIKMKDIGQQLYTSRLTEAGHAGGLTMSPRQPSASRTPRPEAPSLLYQGSEAEACLRTVATCFKCKAVHEVPLQDLKSQGDKYVCFRCNFAVAPRRTFPFAANKDSGGGNPPGGTPPHVPPTAGPAAAAAAPPGNKFKVRNFKPGKYYCDKCRFSTKDPLQYKKHTTQHEEIKFICSHCSYVSYTKGEFQRHLVKHTGVFPYRCEYCDYGAIRNDYIVKHRRRVHERPGGLAKRSPKTKEPKGTPPPLPKPEPFQALSQQLTRFSPGQTGGKAKTPESSTASSGQKQKDVVCVPTRTELPSRAVVAGKLGRFEDKNVEVEVLSPAREPLQPGMPLTVVAPSELVVPANCLAQLVDVKVVNGTQQLVLKFFPLDGNGSPEPTLTTEGADTSDPEQPAGDEASDRSGPKPFREQPRAPGPTGLVERQLERRLERLGGLHSLQPLIRRQLRDVRWVRSYDLFKAGVRDGHREWLLPSSDPGEDWRERATTHRPHRAPALPPLSLKRPLSPASLLRSGVLRGLGAASGAFQSRAAACLAEVGDSRGNPGSSGPLFPLPSPGPAALSFPTGKGLLPLSKGGLGAQGHISIPVTMVPSGQKPREGPAEEPRTTSHLGIPSTAPPQSKYLQVSLPGGGEVPARTQRPGRARPLELPASQRSREALEGPVISSVFSLSSGSADVPEGVQWSSSGCRIKSIELLRQKIAKLIESCGRPASLAAGTAHRQLPDKRGAVTTSQDVREISVSFSSGTTSCSLGSPREAQATTGEANRQLPPGRPYPQFLEAGRGETTDGRVTRKRHVSTPVLIPKGAVLRVLNSSEDATGIIEATCDAPVAIPCSLEAPQRSEPPPLLPETPADSEAQPTVAGTPERSSGPESPPALRTKLKREVTPCSLAPKRASPQHAQPGVSSEQSNLGRLPSRSFPTSKNKAKQASTPKKKGKMPPTPPPSLPPPPPTPLPPPPPPAVSTMEPARCLKDPSIFQVARQLRLMAAKADQLIKCPRRNQPVIVLNHPDVDPPEVTNVMKVINKYKGNVLKVVLSERTRYQLGVRRHHVRLTYQNAEQASHVRRQMLLKMKLKKVHRNNYQVVDALPEDSTQCIFKCWFCGRLYEDQEEWMSHGQRHLIEATRDWEQLSSKAK